MRRYVIAGLVTLLGLAVLLLWLISGATGQPPLNEIIPSSPTSR